MSIEQTDKESAAVAMHPRVSLADIEASIGARYHFTADKAVAKTSTGTYAGDFEVPIAIEALQLLSICILVMRNGFTVIGKSAPASPENFNADLGKKFAYEDAIRQMWPLMGFALRDKLAAK
jgi:hypothetical protein